MNRKSTSRSTAAPQSSVRQKTYGLPRSTPDQQHKPYDRYSSSETEPKGVAHSSKSVKEKRNPGLYDHLITELGLQLYFPRKINLSDVQERSSRCIKEAQDIPWVLLNRLLMADGTARDTCCEVFNKNVEGPFGDDLAMLRMKLQGLSTDDKNIKSLHPTDVLQATLACCDLLLLQSVFHKMFMCRLAIPMMSLSNDNILEFMIWSSYEILFECSQHVETRAVKAPLPIVSFVRIGQLNQSKSILLNAMLKSTCHTFFNRESPCGRVKPSTSGGLLEVSWLLPKDINKIDPILFMNLRGDGPYHPNFNKIISLFSQVVVLITSFRNLTEQMNFDVIKNYMSGNTNLKVIVVLLLNGESQDDMRSKACNDLWKMKVKCVTGFDDQFQPITMNELQQKLHEAIRQSLSSLRHAELSSLENLAEKHRTDRTFVIDYQLRQYQKADTKLKPFISKIDNKSSSEIKTLLVLQDEPWKKLSHLTKQQFKTHAKSCDILSDDDLKKIKKEKKELRKEQCKLIDDKSYLMKEFLELLAKKKQESSLIQIILQRLKLILDDKTREYLPSLTVKCHALWNDLNKKRMSPSITGSQSVEIKMTEEEFHKAERTRHSASLGLEHFLREIAQIYEAKKENATFLWMFSGGAAELPVIMANQIMKGVPFEIMDGDTGCIPIQWLEAVFSQLNKLLKNKRVFVLTALGIQSSGKSTLLNFMFGLQFTVSAGRCTRGIFAQLCKVDTSVYDFEYILVVDTEGLRAPELGHHNYDHDNELAMLVLGLGDVTIVNFKGESTTELRDVLQTAVHAFIKLKIANRCKDLKQQCIFIYQNAPSITAKEKILMAQQRLEDTLDEMTQIAAKIESRPDITSFKQVIKFEGKKHFSTFADLWQGEAPMNSVNPGYISDAASVKECILQVFQERTNRTIEDIFLRIRDLWDGMLSMDFVFSFRNSLEMKAYDLLESEYRKQICIVEECITNWYCQKGQPEILHSHSTTEIEEAKNTVELSLNVTLEKESKSAWLQLNDFMHNDEIMLEWEFARKLKFQNEIEEIKSRQKHNIEKHVMIQTIEAHKREENSRIFFKLSRKAEEIAMTLQFPNDDENNLRQAFDDIWEGIMREMGILPFQRYAKLNVKESFQDVLAQYLMKDANLLREYLPLKPSEQRKSLVECIQPSNVANGDLHILDDGKHPFSHYRHLALNKIRSIMHKITMYIDGKRRTACQFQRDFANHIIQDLLASLAEHNNNPSQDVFIFQATLTVKLCVIVSQYAITVFEEKDIEYEKSHGFTAKLSSWKDMNWYMFTDTVAKKRKEIIVARYISNALKPSIKAAVEREMSVFASSIMKSSFHTKQKMIRNILEDIADDEDFSGISHYLDDDITFAQRWLVARTDNSLFQRRLDGSTIYANKAKVVLCELIDKTKQTVSNATEDMVCTDLKTWLSEFKKKLDRRVIYGDELEFVSDKQIEDFSHFEKQLHSYLDTTEVDLNKEFMCVTSSSIQWVNSYPYDNILGKIWGCSARCPFCFEVCQHSDADHLDVGMLHETNQHRPRGIRGRHWSATTKLVWNNCSHSVSRAHQFRCFQLCVSEGKCEEIHGGYHYYKDYKTIFPGWHITPTPDVQCAKYWMWITSVFRKHFEQKFNRKWSDIPDSWTKLTQSDAKNSLKQAYEF